MILKELQPAGISRIYHRHISRDFPPMERRPLQGMLQLRRRGLYSVLILEDGGELAAYAALAGSGEEGAYLLDYLAVPPALRSRGWGGRMLSALADAVPGAMLVEVEDPDAAIGDDREDCLRRIAFYARSGYADTGIRVRVWGVDYRILGRGMDDDAAEKLDAVYRKIYPDLIYRSQIHYFE